MKNQLLWLYNFVLRDIWRLTENELKSSRWRLLYQAIKVLVVSVRGFVNDRLSTKASALTYNTLLSLVPVSAMLIAIARGFGFQKMLQNELQKHFSGQQEVLTYIFDWVDSYLLQAMGKGVFVGVGIVVLLWSVLSVFGNIESAFNEIWQVKKGRTFLRQMTDYFSLMLILPIFVLLSGSISIFVNSTISGVLHFDLLAPIAKFGIKLIPYALNWILFSLIYVIVPNTRVRFGSALVAGIVAGSAFQIFQYAYINGQIWVSTYNAVYGSFAALPLLLLWLQLSWLIVLFGAQLSFAIQNIRNFDFDSDSRQVSERYKDFLYLALMSLVAKRFERDEPPCTPTQLSTEYHIPIRLVLSQINDLMEAGLLIEVFSENDREQAYMPAFDINQLSVSVVLERLKTKGSENFAVDTKQTFAQVWSAVTAIEQQLKTATGEMLVKDLVN